MRHSFEVCKLCHEHQRPSKSQHEWHLCLQTYRNHYRQERANPQIDYGCSEQSPRCGNQSASPLLVARKTITRPRFTSIITITPTPFPTATTTTTLSLITADTTFDTAVTSTTTITVTKFPSTTPTARPPSSLDGPSSPMSTSSTELAVSPASIIHPPQPSATPPAETPNPTPRPKTVLIITSACAALFLIIDLALTGWFFMRRRRRRRHLYSHKRSSDSSGPNSSPLPSRSNLYGLEYRVSPDKRRGSNGAHGSLVPHSRHTLPSELPSERWSKPFMENLQHILGNNANPFDPEEEAMHRVITGGPGML